MFKKIAFAIALALILTFVLYPKPASACSCAVWQTPEEAIDSATAIFSGRVIAIEGPEGCMICTGDPARVTFQVDEVWKGPEQSILEVTTAFGSVSCGYEFAFGHSYIVYAYGEEESLQVSLCSRTGILSSATEDIQALGESRVTFCQDGNDDNSNQVSAAAISEEGNGFNYVAVITFVVGILVGLLGYDFFTRRRIAARK